MTGYTLLPSCFRLRGCQRQFQLQPGRARQGAREAAERPASGENRSQTLRRLGDLELTAVAHRSLHVYVRRVVLVVPTGLQVDRAGPAADVSGDHRLHGMKNTSVSLHLFIAGQEIFLRRRPLETRRSHARRPAATLPTRFSIKQANNTIPTPINK